MSSFSTWPSPPHSSLPDHRYSTLGANQLPSSYASCRPSSGGQGGSYGGFDWPAGDLYSASSACPQNSSINGVPLGSLGYGLSNWSSNEVERDRDILVAHSPVSQHSHRSLASLGNAKFSPPLGDIGGVMGDQSGSASGRLTSFDESRPWIWTEKDADRKEYYAPYPLLGGLETTPAYQIGGRGYCGSNYEQGMGNQPIQCLITGCRTKKAFGNQQAFQAHVRNVHCDKLWECPEEDCMLAFRNRTDLKRHKQSIHDKEKPYRCQRPNCRARAKAFSRKDKLQHHDRKYHSNFKCWFCSLDPRFEQWFEDQQELWDHTNKKHSEWHQQGEQYPSYPPLAPGYSIYGPLHERGTFQVPPASVDFTTAEEGGT